MIEAIIIGILIFAPIARGAVRIWAFGPIQIGIYLAIFLWIYTMVKNKVIIFKKTILDIPIGIFFLISFISLSYSKYLNDSLSAFFMWLSFFAIYYLIVNCMDTEKKIEHLVGIIIAVGFFLSVIGLLQYLGGIGKSWWSNPKFLSSTYVNHNHFAGYLEMVIPIAMAVLFVSSSKGGLKIISTYALLIMFIAFILTMSRGGWFSLFFSSGIMLILLRSKNFLNRGRTFFFILIFVSFISFVAWSGFSDEILSRAATYKELDFNGRLEIWQATLSMIKEHPFTGTGIGSFIHRVPKYRPEGLNTLINFAHNDFLHILSEIGIFGFLAFIFILFSVATRGIRIFFISHTPIKKALGLGIGMATLSMIIHSLADFNLHIPANSILFFALSGILANISSKKEPRPIFVRILLGKGIKTLMNILIITLFLVAEIFVTRNLFAEICIGRGDRFSKNEDFYNAGLSYQTSIALCPWNSKYYLKSGGLYLQRAIREETNRDIWLDMSKEDFKKAIQINPCDGWAWSNLSDLYKIEYDLPQARYAMEKALEIDPNNSFYLKQLGKIALNTNDVKEAFGTFTRVKEIESRSKSLSICPSKVLDRGYNMRNAELKFASGEIEDALNLFELVDKISPSEEIKFKEFLCYFRLGRLKEALEKFRKLTPDVSHKGIFLGLFSEFNLLKNRFILAEALSEKAYRLNPEDPYILSARFKILKALKRKAESKTVFEKLLSLNKKGNLEIETSGNILKASFDLDWRLINEIPKVMYFILLPGLYEIEVTAQGELARNEGPEMIISLNSNQQIKSELSDEKLKVFTREVEIFNPENLFRAEFKNDFYNPETGEDRNLFIKGVTFRYRYGN